MRFVPYGLSVLFLFFALGGSSFANSPGKYRGPVIDVHLHAATAKDNGPPPLSVCPGFASELKYDPAIPWPQFFIARAKAPKCENPIISPMTDDAVRDDTISEMRRLKVRGVLSGPPDRVAAWHRAAPALFIKGRGLNIGNGAVTPDSLEAEHNNGGFEVLAEVTNQYAGIMADDDRFDPFLAMAAGRDIPVGIHMGLAGPPGAPAFFPKTRLQRPTTLEPVLTRYPGLRVYIMHAGWPFLDDLKAMLYQYPGLYVDTGILQLALTRKDYHGFLKALVDAGYGDRIMFGSDQMNWPGLIEEGIKAINTAPLTYDEKKAILHDNAVRFFRLTDSQKK